MIFNSPAPDSIPDKNFLWKRLFIFLLDGLMCLIICFALAATAGNASTKAICKEEITQMNIQYKEVSSEYDVSLKKYWEFGLYQVDEAKYINDHLDKGENRDEIDKKLDDIKSDISKKLNANQSYKNNYKKVYVVNKMSFVVCMLIPLIAFQLVVPLCTKKRQTLF
ncbi:MAG TPA: hypothetical protein DCY93_04180, partial [Firmicutes bacterium]|nr:hypothetical protein [Bacillota bacterium]